MQEAITFTELGWIIIFIVVVSVGVFAAMAFKSLNQVLKNTNALLETNRESLNRIIPNLADISDNSVVISQDLKKTVTESGKDLEEITHTTADTVHKLSQTADHVSTYALMGGEIAKVLIDLIKEYKK